MCPEYDYVELRYPLFGLHSPDGCICCVKRKRKMGKSSSDNKNKYLIIPWYTFSHHITPPIQFHPTSIVALAAAGNCSVDVVHNQADENIWCYDLVVLFCFMLFCLVFIPSYILYLFFILHFFAFYLFDDIRLYFSHINKKHLYYIKDMKKG